MNHPDTDIADAIIAGMGSADGPTEQMAAIVTSLERAGFEIVQVARHEALMAAAKDGTALAKAEEVYRSYHDRCGDGAIETGRAWDVMRRTGERMRTSLAALRAAGIDLEET
jgi:hypothetical protein